MEPDHLIREYLLLGLRFDRIEEGYVDSFTGDPALRRQVTDEPAPEPAALTAQARRLLDALPDVPRTGGFTDQRAEFIAATELEVKHKNQAFLSQVGAWFDKQITAGQLRSFPRDVYQSLVLGPCQDFVCRWLAGRAKTELDAAAEQLGDAVWRGLKAQE